MSSQKLLFFAPNELEKFLTNYDFENNGLYEEYEDEGRFRLTGLESDRALFKVPSLRNIAVTAPYMHDGSINTLDDVIEHYTSGIKDAEYTSKLVYQNEGQVGIPLTTDDKIAIKEFLHTLTDPTFLNNTNLSEF